MAEANHAEHRAHVETYSSFSKLVMFMILWITLLLSSMALGLVAHFGFLSVVLGVGGTIVLIAAFAMMN